MKRNTFLQLFLFFLLLIMFNLFFCSEAKSQIIVTPNDTICSGDSVTMTMPPGTCYAWGYHASYISIYYHSTGPRIEKPTVSTTYYVTILSPDLCDSLPPQYYIIGYDSIRITVLQVPPANAGVDDTICLGDSIIINATGGNTYSWSNGQSTPSIKVSPNVQTTYTVTVTGDNGCTASDDVTIYVLYPPIASAGPDKTICLGDSVTLFASGGVTYSWSSGQSTSNITVKPIVQTTYIVTVTNLNGCTATDDVTVYVLWPLIPNIGPDDTICEGDTVTLSATGGVSYAWSSGQTTATIEVAPTVTTTYIVTVTDQNNCAYSDTLIIVVYPKPVVSFYPLPDLCENDNPYDLTNKVSPSGGTFSSWWVTNNKFDPWAAFPGIHYIGYTYTDTNGCSSYEEEAIRVHEMPEITLDTVPDVCIYTAPFILTVGHPSGSLLGNPPLGWYEGPGIGDSITFFPDINNAGVGTHTIVYFYIDTNWCRNSDTFQITVHPLPPADAGMNDTICEGDTVMLTASGGQSFVWSTGDTTATIKVTPTITTTYFVTVTDHNGCTSSDDVVVIVFPKPVVTFLPIPHKCVYKAPFDISGYTSPSGGTFTGPGILNTTFSPAVAGPGNHLLTYTYTDENGCTNFDIITIQVIPRPEITIDSVTHICINTAPFTLTIASPTGNLLWNLPFSWYEGPGIGDSITFNPAAVDAGIGTHIITYYYIDLWGCYNSATAKIVVHPQPAADAGLDDTICEGDTITLTATGGVSYVWSSGQTTSEIEISPTVSTIYVVTVTDQYNCSKTDTVNIVVMPKPSVSFFSLPDLCENDNPLLLTSYVLPTGGTFSSWWVTNNKFDPWAAFPGIHYIGYTYTDTNGCTAYEEEAIRVHEMPEITLDTVPDVCINTAPFILTVGHPSGSLLGNPPLGWYEGPGIGDSITFFPDINNAGVGTHTIVYFYIDTNWCRNSDTFQITVHPLPNANAGPDDTICAGDTILLSATGGISYNWSSGQSTQTIIVTPTVTTTYSVTVTDQNGCTNSDEVVITVFPLPEVTFKPLPDMCINQFPSLVLDTFGLPPLG
ncbi:hypothetical protein ACFLRZ_04095, partial [Bacteroidota bacterium]